jgi:4-aminobutyrate aminotransferase-like enzyme
MGHFSAHVDRVSFTNRGSEANKLALAIARQHAGNTGVLVSDVSYHGNTTSLAVLTTGLQVLEPLGEHVRALRIPDAPWRKSLTARITDNVTLASPLPGNPARWVRWVPPEKVLVTGTSVAAVPTAPGS